MRAENLNKFDASLADLDDGSDDSDGDASLSEPFRAPSPLTPAVRRATQRKSSSVRFSATSFSPSFFCSLLTPLALLPRSHFSTTLPKAVAAVENAQPRNGATLNSEGDGDDVSFQSARSSPALSVDSFQSATSELEEASVHDETSSSGAESLDLRLHLQSKSRGDEAAPARSPPTEHPLPAALEPSTGSLSRPTTAQSLEEDVFLPDHANNNDNDGDAASVNDSMPSPSASTSSLVSSSTPSSLSDVFELQPGQPDSDKGHPAAASADGAAAEEESRPRRKFRRSTPVGHSMRSVDGSRHEDRQASALQTDEEAAQEQKRTRSLLKPPPPRRKLVQTRSISEAVLTSGGEQHHSTAKDTVAEEADAAVVNTLYQHFYGVPQSRPSLRSRTKLERKTIISALSSAGELA